MDDLTLQIGQLDQIVIDDAERADPGRRQIEQQRCPQPAGADHQHARRQQPRLARLADLVEDQVAGIAVELRVGKVVQRVHIPSNSAVER